jgi:hypothetical protein
MGGSPIGFLLLGMGDLRALVSDGSAGRLSSVIDTLREAIAALDGVVESPSMFKDDLAYWVHGKEIAHFETRDLIEIRLTRSVIRERRDVLKADSRIDLRYSGPIGSMFASLHQLILISCSIWWRRRPLRIVHRPVSHRIHLLPVRIWNVVVASTSHLVRYSAAQEVPICLPPMGVRY